MRSELKSDLKRLFALLAILSFIFTQSCPAWALRMEGGSSELVRDLIKTGLEEAGAPIERRRYCRMPPFLAPFWPL